MSTVSVIDTDTDAVTDTIPVGNAPFDVAVSADGNRIYVSSAGDDTLTAIEYAGPDSGPGGSGILANLPELVGKLIGGAAGDGGGWLIIGDHVYPIPPGPPALFAIARAAAPYLGAAKENRQAVALLRKMQQPNA